MSDRPVALVTGANAGIGLVTATELATRGYRVVVTCRSPEKGRQTIEHIERHVGDNGESGSDASRFLIMEMADLDSVRACAHDFKALGLPLDLLINNAGQARLRGRTKQGWENAWGINHLAPVLLTELLTPELAQATRPRVVTVSSDAHSFARGISWSKLRDQTSRLGVREYAESKLANLLFSRELSRRTSLKDLRTYAVHPGVVATSIWRNAPSLVDSAVSRFFLTTEEGAQTTLYCATSELAADETGLYYTDSRPKTPSKLGRDDHLASEVWERSREMLELPSS